MDLLDDDGLLDLRSRARRTDPAAVAEEERQRRRDTDDANDDLREWMAGQGVDQAVPEAEDADPDTCHVCKQRSAKYRCAHCRRGACAAHHWVMFGLCHRCATEDRIARWHAQRRPEEDNWLDLGGPGVGP